MSDWLALIYFHLTTCLHTPALGCLLCEDCIWEWKVNVACSKSCSKTLVLIRGSACEYSPAVTQAERDEVFGSLHNTAALTDTSAHFYERSLAFHLSTTPPH